MAKGKLDQVTEKQRKTLERKKTVSVYEGQRSIVDKETGEILQKELEVSKRIGTEPDYIKVYYKTMMAFCDVDNIPLNFILGLAKHLTWTNDASPMLFQNSKIVRTKICEELGIKDCMYARYLKRCKDYGILIQVDGFRGSYEANPFFIAQGRWDSIRQLRAEFDFTGGQWKRIVEIEEN